MRRWLAEIAQLSLLLFQSGKHDRNDFADSRQMRFERSWTCNLGGQARFQAFPKILRHIHEVVEADACFAERSRAVVEIIAQLNVDVRNGLV